MNILVCISRVPDTTTKIKLTDNQSFDTNGVNFILNPTDEWFALVRGLELKEQFSGSVTVIHVGEAAADQNIKKALAIGADQAVRINANPTDSYFVAGQIADYAKQHQFDLVLTGKETIDYNGSVVGGMIAEFMQVPFVSLATNLQIESNTATIVREIEGGKETCKANLPLVISAQKGMAEQRIPTMRGIMTARSKPIDVVEPNASIQPLTAIETMEIPTGRQSVKLVAADNVDELVRLLHQEAKAI